MYRNVKCSMKCVPLQIRTKDVSVTLGQNSYWCNKKNSHLSLNRLMYCSDEYLGFSSARLTEKNAVFTPRRIFRVTAVVFDTLVQKSFTLGQTVDNVLINCPLERRERIKRFHRCSMEIFYARINQSSTPQEQNVM